MHERVHPRWPAHRPTTIHWIQARLAFERGAEAYPARLIGVVAGTALVERMLDTTTVALVVALPDRLTALLGREDLTLFRGTPLALVSERYGVLAIATGPKELSGPLCVRSNVSRVDGGEAVEIPAVENAQPSLQILAAVRACG
jgi:hypothetical protein